MFIIYSIEVMRRQEEEEERTKEIFTFFLCRSQMSTYTRGCDLVHRNDVTKFGNTQRSYPFCVPLHDGDDVGDHTVSFSCLPLLQFETNNMQCIIFLFFYVIFVFITCY